MANNERMLVQSDTERTNYVTILELLENFCLFQCVNPHCLNSYCKVKNAIDKLNRVIEEKEAQSGYTR